MSNTELYHHGVKGMKWGVRRARKRTSVQASGNKTKRLNKNSSVSEASKSGSAARGKKIVKGALIGAGAIGTVAVAVTVGRAAYTVGRLVNEVTLGSVNALKWAKDGGLRTVGL